MKKVLTLILIVLSSVLYSQQDWTKTIDMSMIIGTDTTFDITFNRNTAYMVQYIFTSIVGDSGYVNIQQSGDGTNFGNMATSELPYMFDSSSTNKPIVDYYWAGNRIRFIITKGNITSGTTKIVFSTNKQE